jgi:serine/threonine-protein kinase
MLFWYRSSPRPMAPTAFDVFDQPALRVTRDDPTMRVPGMTAVYLNAGGRLAQLQVVAPQREDGEGQAPAPNWGLLFSEAGIDLSRYTPVEPRWPPPTYADALAAWEGPHPDRPEIRARIEAAAYRGRPVSFLIVGPWDYPGLQAPYSPTTGELAGLWAFYIAFLAVLVAGVVLARRNLRLERGDRAGAVRLCVAAIVLSLASWAIGSAHTATEDELRMFLNAIGAALFNGFLVGTFYLALEPFIRRRFPRALVSWSRLLAGRWRDWLVGRDVLLGTAGAVATQVVWCLAWRLGDRYGAAIPTYQSLLSATLISGRAAVSSILERFLWALIIGFLYFFLFVVALVLVRRVWIAVAVAALVIGLQIVGSLTPALSGSFFLFTTLAFLALLTRFGFVAGTSYLTAEMLLFGFPMTSDMKAWYAGAGLLCLGVLAALMIWGARTAAIRRAPARAE